MGESPGAGVKKDGSTRLVLTAAIRDPHLWAAVRAGVGVVAPNRGHSDFLREICSISLLAYKPSTAERPVNDDVMLLSDITDPALRMNHLLADRLGPFVEYEVDVDDHSITAYVARKHLPLSRNKAITRSHTTAGAMAFSFVVQAPCTAAQPAAAATGTRQPSTEHQLDAADELDGNAAPGAVATGVWVSCPFLVKSAGQSKLARGRGGFALPLTPVPVSLEASTALPSTAPPLPSRRHCTANAPGAAQRQRRIRRRRVGEATGKFTAAAHVPTAGTTHGIDAVPRHDHATVRRGLASADTVRVGGRDGGSDVVAPEPHYRGVARRDTHNDVDAWRPVGVFTSPCGAITVEAYDDRRGSHGDATGRAATSVRVVIPCTDAAHGEPWYGPPFHNFTHALPAPAAVPSPHHSRC